MYPQAVREFVAGFESIGFQRGQLIPVQTYIGTARAENILGVKIIYCKVLRSVKK